MEAVLTGGDDYELLFTAPPKAEAKLHALAKKTGVPITRIGDIAAGTGVRVVDAAGRDMQLRKTGYTHG